LKFIDWLKYVVQRFDMIIDGSIFFFKIGQEFRSVLH